MADTQPRAFVEGLTAKTPTSWYELIAPERAKRYLARNIHNRPVRKALLARLCKALRGSHWQVTHQGVAFDTNLVLLDGQHRLMAIVETGIAATMLVTIGLAPGSQLVIDTGSSRSSAQNAGLMGVVNAKLVTAWGNVIKAMLMNTEAQGLTADEVVRLDEENRAALDAAFSYGRSPLLKGAVGGAFLYAQTANPVGVALFFNRFKDGENIVKGSGVYAARKYYFESPKRLSDTRWDTMNKILRCTMADLEGTTIHPDKLVAGDGPITFFGKHHSEDTLIGELYQNWKEKKG